MTLALMVAGRQSGTFGTFEVDNGNVSKNRIAILNFFGNTTALVPLNARSNFTTAEEHAAFDATLMGLSQVGVGIQYVESVAKFMDPKARFKEWLEGKLDPATVGLTLTAEELAVPIAYESAKAKFIEVFTAPMPKLSEGGIDLIAAGFSPDQAASIDRWRTSSGSILPSALNLVRTDPANRNVLRIVNTNGNAYRVENALGHSINRTQFLRAYNETIKPVWARTPPNGEIGRLGACYVEGKERGSNYSNNQRVEVFNNHVTVGCQSIPRAEVERIVAEFAKMGITR